jgi:hypothetical protein
MFSVSILKNSDASCTFVYPSSEGLVPFFDFKHCGGVRALCIHKKLLIKAQLEVATGRTQKALPAIWAA